MAGSEVLAKDAKRVLERQLENRIAGVSELLERIGSEVMTEKEIHDFFKEELAVNWQTRHQTAYRLRWLINTGKINKKGDRYYLV